MLNLVWKEQNTMVIKKELRKERAQSTALKDGRRLQNVNQGCLQRFLFRVFHAFKLN